MDEYHTHKDRIFLSTLRNLTQWYTAESLISKQYIPTKRCRAQPGEMLQNGSKPQSIYKWLIDAIIILGTWGIQYLLHPIRCQKLDQKRPVIASRTTGFSRRDMNPLADRMSSILPGLSQAEVRCIQITAHTQTYHRGVSLEADRSSYWRMLKF